MRNCAASFAATPERFIDVDWDLAAMPSSTPKGEGFTGRISVIADQVPLSADDILLNVAGVFVNSSLGEIRGMDIVFVTSARTDEEAKALLEGFDVPFQK